MTITKNIVNYKKKYKNKEIQLSMDIKMSKLYYLAAILIVSAVITIASSQEVKNEKEFRYASCNVTNTTEQTSDCPKESKCIEIGHNVTVGNCVCPVNFTINSEFFKSNTTGVSYCLKKENVAPATTTTTQLPVTVQVSPKEVALPSTTTTTTIKPIVVSTKQPEVTTIINNNNKKPSVIDDEVKIQPAVGSHHVFGGILLPILIVFAFIASAFAIKKYDLIDKAHGFIRQRYHHSQYDGIIMENDFDDDPLLI